MVEYPFSPKTITVGGHKLNYVDEGKGEVLLFLHGNPTWSFYYRNLISHFSKTHRCIALDNIGCGLSDKPQDYEYTLENHIQNVTKLVAELELTNITIMVHDWGGAIGFGYATRFPQNVKKMVVFNTAAFPDLYIPSRIAFLKTPVIGEFLTRTFNLFAWPATFMTTEKPLSPEIKKAYLKPYDNYMNRIATAKFVQDIPMNKNHPTYKTLKEIEDKLPLVLAPKIFIWGAKDWCFTTHFLDRFKQIYPEAQTHVLPKAGHYVVEDGLVEIKTLLEKFL